jgi:hypothetical protein
MSLHGGLGAVTQKNNVVQYGDFNIGLNACKHANGRDWWLIMLKANTDSVLKILITPTGITSITTQSLSLPQHGEFAGQAQFSPDGSKYAFYHYTGTLGAFTNEIRLMDFDRCNGEFTNSRIYSFPDSVAGLGLSFSANSKYLYYSTFIKIYQFNTDTSNIAASVDTVATYDGYAYPGSLFQTTFWTMYLAANGKIYVSSGNTTIDLNYIDQPDSDGVSCNVMQHALRTPCYIFRSNVLHPNYYLGPVIGSVCDTLAHVGLQEHLDEVQNFSLMPNPVQDGIVKIAYLLPQNESGAFEVFDLNGKRVYQLPLPPWSTMQIIALPPLPGGVYECAIRSGMSKQVRKLVIVR